MLQVEPPVAEADILDAAGEVANMIVGNVRSFLENRWGAIGIGTPVGEISREWALTKQAMSVTFRSWGDIFTVSVAFQNHAPYWQN